MNSMPARSAIWHMAAMSSQLAGQRSGARLMVRPPSQLALNTPSLNAFGPRMGLVGVSIMAFSQFPGQVPDVGARQVRIAAGRRARIASVGTGAGRSEPGGLGKKRLENPNHRTLSLFALSGCSMERTMKRPVLAVLGAIATIGLSAGSAGAWDDSYRDCPGARGCPSAYYSPSFHRGPYYRPLPPVYRYR